GGAFSGKDPSKVDRSAATMARHLALKTLRGSDDAQAVMVQLAYAIGKADPVSYRAVDPHTGKEYALSDHDIAMCTPDAMIRLLHLDRPIYTMTSSRGHFGVAPFEQDGLKHYAWEDEMPDLE
ncbi:MAG: methionine adenosyltransferase domain-containing protein, partial [Candidatus Kapaibacterium sp.]